jgi:CheY-like chemotaxis protein
MLVVEDEPVIRELIAEAWEEAGYEVDAAATTDAAAVLLEADDYTLLVTYVHMPGRLDGLHLAELAGENDPVLPGVVVTGRPDVVHRLRNSGINGTCIPKPFSLEELVRGSGPLHRAREAMIAPRRTNTGLDRRAFFGELLGTNRALLGYPPRLGARSFRMDEAKVEGAFRTAGGRIQDAVGGLTGDAATQLRGKVNEAAGEAQRVYGDTVER